MRLIHLGREEDSLNKEKQDTRCPSNLASSCKVHWQGKRKKVFPNFCNCCVVRERAEEKNLSWKTVIACRLSPKKRPVFFRSGDNNETFILSLLYLAGLLPHMARGGGTTIQATALPPGSPHLSRSHSDRCWYAATSKSRPPPVPEDFCEKHKRGRC